MVNSFLVINSFIYQSGTAAGGARNRLTYTPKKIFSYDLLIGGKQKMTELFAFSTTTPPSVVILRVGQRRDTLG